MKYADRAYDRVGRTEPYYGVLTLNRFLNANLDVAALHEFFETGETQVACVLATIRAHLAADFKPRRALDFGCGVGRILIPLARQAGQAVGVDVSDAMMAEAARNCRERNLTNISFVKSDDQLSHLEGRFDLIHSSIVFQHIAPLRVEVVVRSLLAHLEPGGVGALHFTTWLPLRKRIVHRLKKSLPPVNIAANLYRRRAWNFGLIEMNCFALDRVIGLLAEAGITSFYADFAGLYGGPKDDHGVMIYFQRP
ncbi:MAG: class I SAM-dependent methyltransferase [Candidatus Binataceae bacterium]